MKNPHLLSAHMFPHRRPIDLPQHRRWVREAGKIVIACLVGFLFGALFGANF